MNKKFTKLIAALALLVFIAPPLVGWGQTRTDVTGTMNFVSNPKPTSPVTSNNVEFSWTSSNIAVSTSGTSTGFKKNSDMTVTIPSGATLKTIAITNGAQWGNVAKIYVYAGSDSNGTLIATFVKNGDTSFDITSNNTGTTYYFCNSTTGNAWITALSITYQTISGYTVTYNANDGSTAPATFTDNNNNSGYSSGATVTVLPNDGDGNPNFTKTGYSFVWWSDKQDWSTSGANVYVPEDPDENTFVITANTTLYAQWDMNKYNVAIAEVDNVDLYAEYGTNEMLIEGSDEDIDYGTELTLTADELATGFMFVWQVTDDEDNDVTSEVLSGNTLTVPAYDITISGTVVPSCIITFNAGTGTCDTETMTGYEGSSITLPTAEPSYGCGQAGWTFIGWATAEITETTTAPTTLTGSYTITGDATLYAVYRDIVIGSVNTSNVFSNGSYNNSIITWTVSNIVSIKQEQNGTNNTVPNSSYVSSPRWYKGNKITITPSVSINSITVTTTTVDYATALANSTYTNATASADSTEVTITPTNGSSAITIVMGGQSRPSSLIVNYATSTTYYNTTPDCVIRHNLALSGNAQVLLFDGEENPIAVENGTALIEEGMEVRVSIDRLDDCQLFESLSVTPTTGTVEVTELEAEVYYSFTMPTCNATLVVSTDDATEYTLNVVKPAEVSFTNLLVGWESSEISLDANNEASICEQANVKINELSIANGYLLKSVSLAYGNETVEVDKNEGGLYSFTMPASNATLTFEVREAATYTLVTSTDDLIPGKHYIIASSKENGNAKAMSYDKGNNRYAVDVTVATQSSKTKITEVKELYEFAISGNTDNWTMYDKNEKEYNGNGTYGYLYNSSSDNNKYLKTNRSLSTVGDNGYWTITFDAENGNAIITAKAGTNKIVRYNSASTLFSCYSTGQQDVYLYMKDDDKDIEFYSNTILASATIENDETYTVHNPALLNVASLTNNGSLFIEDGGQLITNSTGVQATVKKTIAAHGATTADGGWNFIASPINSNSLDPATTGLGMITDNLGNGASETTATYDLYKFVENPTDNGKEWKNYRNATFNLANGQGYLYASKEGTTLNFTGSINPCNQNVEVNLDFTTGAEFAGWNLVGNPFTFYAFLNKPYYKMNENGSAILATAQSSDSIAPCTGVLVHVDATEQSVAFSKNAFRNVTTGNLNIAVLQANERGASTTTVDNAIVSFNEGNELPKFYFMEQNANLYIPQGEKEYAIATSEGQGEMPLNFRANADGQYTLTVNPEGVEMNYLHLIDNMTGNDIDLLQTPSYSFNAKTTDYESRFRLVFAANNENGVSAGSTTFAFYSNDNWMVNNEGEATLQVIDVMGRVLSNQTISGTAELSLNQQPGVYVLRLVNGNDVKTQKIVVK